MTLAGHKEGISGVTWMDSKTEICSASWDHTIKIWDTELAGMKQELVGYKSFFDIAYSKQSRLLITAAAERTLRLYDPRSADGTLVKSAYTSHTGWVTCCDLSSGEYVVSGVADNDMKIFKTSEIASVKT